MEYPGLAEMNNEVVKINVSEEKHHSAWKNMFKSKTSAALQEDRRNQLLEQQKKKREKSFNDKRQLDFLMSTEEKLECDAELAEEEMEFTTTKVKRKFYKYANQLMHSEWMMEVPGDLEEKWYFLPCPTGKRCLVVAQSGNTVAYSTKGKILSKFQSLLPGGCTRDCSRYAVLDCIWSYHSSAYYVLDVLAWGNQPLLDCDTEFRFIWLKSQLEEMPEISTKRKQNKYKFVPLPFAACTMIEMEKILTGSPPFPEVMDGVLFYHKEAHYSAGQSPLVVWLLPFMVPEVLGVPVGEVLAAQKPANYPGHLEFVHHFENQDRRSRKEEYKERKAASKSAKLEVCMDSASSDENEELIG